MFLLRFEQPDVAQYGVLCKRSLCKPLRMCPQDISIATCIRVITCTTVSLRFQRPSSVPQTKPQTRNRSLSAITTHTNRRQPSITLSRDLQLRDKKFITDSKRTARHTAKPRAVAHDASKRYCPISRIDGSDGLGLPVCVWRANGRATRDTATGARDSLTGGRSWRRFIFSRGATVPSAPREVESGA